MKKSVKDNLLKDIDKKAQKIRDKRIDAATNKTVEALVFDFFRQVDEAKEVAQSQNSEHLIDMEILKHAYRNLESRVRSTFDVHSKVEIIWDNGDAPQYGNILGVKIYWSLAYIKKHNVEPSIYIDVGQMLLV